MCHLEPKNFGECSLKFIGKTSAWLMEVRVRASSMTSVSCFWCVCLCNYVINIFAYCVEMVAGCRASSILVHIISVVDGLKHGVGCKRFVLLPGKEHNCENSHFGHENSQVSVTLFWKTEKVNNFLKNKIKNLRAGGLRHPRHPRLQHLCKCYPVQFWGQIWNPLVILHILGPHLIRFSHFDFFTFHAV